MSDPTGEMSNPGDIIKDIWWQVYNAGYTNITNDVKSEVKAYQQAAEQLPVSGDISSLYSVVTGQTLFTGEQCSWAGRVLAWASSALIIAPEFKGIGTWVKSSTEVVKFSEKALSHIKNPDRYIPTSIMDTIIKSTKWVPDPRWTSATMHYGEMSKNGKTYNVEVLYNKAMNMIQHFKYTEKPIWNLASKKK